MVQEGNDNNSKATSHDERDRVEEQRRHPRKATHAVKQKMRGTTCDVVSQFDKTMLQTMVAAMDVAEFYSLPRTARTAANIGLRVGWGMDITTSMDELGVPM